MPFAGFPIARYFSTKASVFYNDVVLSNKTKNPLQSTLEGIFLKLR